jgi:hypothetical protein
MPGTISLAGDKPEVFCTLDSEKQIGFVIKDVTTCWKTRKMKAYRQHDFIVVADWKFNAIRNTACIPGRATRQWETLASTSESGRGRCGLPCVVRVESPAGRRGRGRGARAPRRRAGRARPGRLPQGLQVPARAESPGSGRGLRVNRSTVDRRTQDARRPRHSGPHSRRAGPAGPDWQPS